MPGRCCLQCVLEAKKSIQCGRVTLSNAPVLALTNFERIFEVDCDASNIGIGADFSQEPWLVAFLSEKLGEACARYS